ncbi:MAG: DUF1553 domain-containing protein [Verrucomicrobia bacterium]|nr:DUF1553 domain-containing protein [Verrucomicrobiota bacterium]
MNLAKAIPNPGGETLMSGVLPLAPGFSRVSGAGETETVSTVSTRLAAGRSVSGKPLKRLCSGVAFTGLKPGANERGLLLGCAMLLVFGLLAPVGASEKATKASSTDWWSLKPLVRPAVPGGAKPEVRSQNPVDAFIRAKLAEKNLSPSPETEPRVLIRRLYFDLLGLPPKPEEVEAFEAECRSGSSFIIHHSSLEKLVDRLLASPHYGERWARHWLDVVHYGDTHGYDKDKPRPNAWPYRDYVIRAFNEDRPYERFIQEQVAGDVLFPGTRDGVEALGFIAAGPWDFIGHAEVPESKIDGKIARHLDRDDMVVNTMQTFNSLTVGCAQCHDHKFDPIPQRDYYRLQAVFAAVDRAEKKYFTDAKLTQRFAELEHRQRTLTERRAALETKLKLAAGKELEALDTQIEAVSKAKGGLRPEYGYHSAISPTQDAAKWVQVDLGRSVVIDRVVLRPCYDDFNKIGAGFGFPVRFKVEASEEDLERGRPRPQQAPADVGVRAPLLLAAHTTKDFTNPGTAPQTFKSNGATARYIRVTATQLAPRQNDFILALAELQVFDSTGSNVALKATVTALDSIEAPPRWRKTNLTDDIAPASDNSGELADLRVKRDALLAKFTDNRTRAELATLAKDLEQVAAELKQFPKPAVVFAGTVHYGSGSFAGTGPAGGKPRVIQVLNRGDVKQPKDEVAPAAPSYLTGLPGEFALPAGHGEAERRAALAKWLSSPDNPLTWRSMVNRVWQYHFGRGLVETPNDFGRNGALPTHPELLDWLAVEFRDGGGSLKKLHKLIVTSATYRQESGEKYLVISNQSKTTGTPNSSLITNHSFAQTTDSANTLLWRQNRRKLDAEAVRDATLFVAGKLDLRMGGPAFQDFIVEKPEHSPHYEYHLHDPEDPKSHRRSVYRFLVRSQTQPFMTTLDCADPSMQVGRRNESVSALQALALLNNGLMVTMSKHFAAKLDAGGGDLNAKMDRAFREALARAPSPSELANLTAYAQQHGLANACRVLFNLNEFAFVD